MLAYPHSNTPWPWIKVSSIIILRNLQALNNSITQVHPVDTQRIPLRIYLDLLCIVRVDIELNIAVDFLPQGGFRFMLPSPTLQVFSNFHQLCIHPYRPISEEQCLIVPVKTTSGHFPHCGKKFYFLIIT